MCEKSSVCPLVFETASVMVQVDTTLATGVSGQAADCERVNGALGAMTVKVASALSPSNERALVCVLGELRLVTMRRVV